MVMKSSYYNYKFEVIQGFQATSEHECHIKGSKVTVKNLRFFLP